MLRARRRREKDSGGPLSRLVGLRWAYKHVRVLVTDCVRRATGAVLQFSLDAVRPQPHIQSFFPGPL